MDTTSIVEAKVTVSLEIYQSLPSRPDRVRECANAAAQAMDAMAAEHSRTLSETPRLVDQEQKALGFVELVFQAETTKR